MSIQDVRLYRDHRPLQPPTRRRGRTDDFAYRQEHVDRLRFIGRARRHGLSLDAIAQLVDADALQTCNDVYRFVKRQIETLQRKNGPDDSAVVALEKLIATCRGVVDIRARMQMFERERVVGQRVTLGVLQWAVPVHQRRASIESTRRAIVLLAQTSA